MKEPKVFIKDLHAEHREWNSNLDLFEDELKVYKHRLEELVLSNKEREVAAFIERYQNQFIRHQEVIDHLRHDIKIHEQSMAAFAHDHPVSDEQLHFADHVKMREEFRDQVRIFRALKEEFNQFIAKHR